MILVFLVVIIVWICVVVHDKSKESDQRKSQYALARRKTNAYKERLVLDGYMKQGMTLQEAYAATQAEMVKLGYEPCIPLNAYTTDTCGNKLPETSYLGVATEEFDSEAVNDRKKILKHRRMPVTDETVYDKFPTNDFDYDHELKMHALQYSAIEIGRWFTYPGLGTLEVLDYIYLPFDKIHYKAKVLATGEIIMYINVEDKKVQLIHKS